jgi:hypothetical protein
MDVSVNAKDAQKMEKIVINVYASVVKNAKNALAKDASAKTNVDVD